MTNAERLAITMELLAGDGDNLAAVWEALASRGVIPESWVADPLRVFQCGHCVYGCDHCTKGYAPYPNHSITLCRVVRAVPEMVTAEALGPDLHRDLDWDVPWNYPGHLDASRDFLVRWCYRPAEGGSLIGLPRTIQIHEGIASERLKGAEVHRSAGFGAARKVVSTRVSAPAKALLDLGVGVYSKWAGSRWGITLGLPAEEAPRVAA